MVKKATNGKSSKKAAPASSGDRSPAIELMEPNSEEHRIRERAHSIWIEEGETARPRPRPLAARPPRASARSPVGTPFRKSPLTSPTARSDSGSPLYTAAHGPPRSRA